MVNTTARPEVLERVRGNLYRFRQPRPSELRPRACIGCGQPFTPHPWNPEFPAHGVSCLMMAKRAE